MGIDRCRFTGRIDPQIPRDDLTRWIVMEKSNGWNEKLRGCRPPSVRWASRFVVNRRRHSRADRQRAKKSPAQQPRSPRSDPVPVRPPEAVSEAARARVAALEAAISAPRWCRWCDFEIVARSFTEGRTSHPCCLHWRAIECVHPLHRACSEAPRISRRGVADPNRACPVGDRAGRRASSIRCVPRRSGIGGLHPTSCADGFWRGSAEDAGCIRRPFTGTFRTRHAGLPGVMGGTTPMDMGTVVDSRSARV